MSTFDYELLPEHIRGGMQRYLENGIAPGGFCLAVLCNNLIESFKRADQTNEKALPEIAAWVYSVCPSDAWGSQFVVDMWMKSGGFEGKHKRDAEKATNGGTNVGK